MKRRRIGLMVGALGAVLVASSAEAGVLGTVWVTQSSSDADTLRMSLVWKGNPEAAATGRTGLYQLAHDTLVSPVDDDEPLWVKSGSLEDVGFCIEPQVAATNERKPYDIRRLEDAPYPFGPGGGSMGATKADQVRELWGRFYYDAVETHAATAVTKAAFHLALLEIIYEDNNSTWKVDEANGNFYTTTSTTDAVAAINQAHAYLSGLTGDSDKMERHLVALSHGSYQDYIVRGHIVPEPSAYAMLLGLGGIGFLGAWGRRRRVARGAHPD